MFCTQEKGLLAQHVVYDVIVFYFYNIVARVCVCVYIVAALVYLPFALMMVIGWLPKRTCICTVKCVHVYEICTVSCE